MGFFSKSLVFAAATALFTQVFAGDVLFVVNSNSSSSGDDLVKARLQSLGHVVTTKDQNVVTTNDANGRSCVIVSNSVRSGAVKATFKDITIPFLTSESYLYDDMGMTRDEVQEDYGVRASYDIDMVDENSPLAAGFYGTVSVYNAERDLFWGRNRTTSVANHSEIIYDKSVIYAYETGENMQGGFTAPGIRVGFGLDFEYASDWNSNGWELFDAAVLYMIGGTQSEPMVRLSAKGDVSNMGHYYHWSASPEHRITFSRDFFIDQYEVTQASYQSLMGYNASSTIGTNLPVDNVNWFDAVLYCNERSKRDGLDTVYSYSAVYGTPGAGAELEDVVIDYDAIGYRLPTEAEWEYALRGYTLKHLDNRFFWGNNDNAVSYAWYDQNSGMQLHPVGSKNPNSYGLFDMNGNVREWCNDYFETDYYSYSNSLDPEGPEYGDYWESTVMRGGSAEDNIWQLQLGQRQTWGRASIANFSGFRCVLPVAKEATDDSYVLEVYSDGQYRTAIVHPGDYNQPLIMYFDGYGGDQKSGERFRAFHTLYPEATVVYMTAQNLNDESYDEAKLEWSDFFRHSESEAQVDVNLTSTVIDLMMQQHSVDPSRVFAAGHSSGGFFTFTLTEMLPERIAAFAPVSAWAGGYESIPAATPKPILYIVGRYDNVFDYNPMPAGFGPTSLEAFQATLDETLLRNSCDIPLSPDYWDTPYASFTPNSGGAPVEYRLHEGGHSWPSEGNNWVVDYFKQF